MNKGVATLYVIYFFSKEVGTPDGGCFLGCVSLFKDKKAKGEGVSYFGVLSEAKLGSGDWLCISLCAGSCGSIEPI